MHIFNCIIDFFYILKMYKKMILSSYHALIKCLQCFYFSGFYQIQKWLIKCSGMGCGNRNQESIVLINRFFHVQFRSKDRFCS